MENQDAIRTTPASSSALDRWLALPERPFVLLMGGLLLFAYGLFDNFVHGPVSWDQNWFLLVAHRVLSGDVLYREIWFVATPLSMYITTALASLLGTEVFVIKVLMSALFALTCVLIHRIARALGVGRFAALLLVLVLLAYYPSWMPGYNVPYTSMGYVFLTATFLALLFWRSDLRRGADAGSWAARKNLAIAGICAGLGFVSKQNLGVLALGMLGLAVWVVQRGMRSKTRATIESLALVAAAFWLATGVALLPVLWSGSLAKMLDYGFLDQGTYMSHAQITYGSQLALLVNLARQATSLEGLGALLRQSPFILPFLAFPALAWTWVRGSERRELATLVLLFAAVSFAGIFPRVDINHMICAAPALLLALALVSAGMYLRLNARRETIARVAILAGLLLWLGYQTAGSVRWMANGLRTGRYQFAPWPRFTGVFLRTDFIQDANAQAALLKQSVAGDEVFILSLPAAFYYHVTELMNPTPFDFPLSTAFGLHGQEEVIAALERGQICDVCVSPLGSHTWAPVKLESYVLERLELVREISWCTVYHNPVCVAE